VDEGDVEERRSLLHQETTFSVEFITARRPPRGLDV
jgi:hypothetical protein